MESKTLKIIIIIESAILLFTLILCGCLFGKLRHSDDSIPASADVYDGSSDVRIRPYIEKEETFYQFDGKKILVHDSAFGETFIPVYADVPASSFDPSCLVNRQGRLEYKEGENLTALSGIDISGHQGDINWEEVKASGISFAIVRAGFRTYGGGVLTLDEQFRDNIIAAQQAGLETGAYFYSQATTVDEALEEADAVLDSVAGLEMNYPIVFDWEMIFDDNARTDSVSVETLADMCVAFCERIKGAGYTPMIYQNTSTAMKKLDLPRVAQYDFWLAEYGDEPSFYYDFAMWQYTSTGHVPGIEGSVDLNLCFKDYANGGERPSIPDTYIEPETENDPSDEDSSSDEEVPEDAIPDDDSEE